MSEALLELNNIRKSYGNVEALRGVSLTLPRGEFLTVFGPNGAGKSTLLKIISTQTNPTSGDMSFEGTPVKKLKDDFRSRFGVISHQPFVYDNLTAEENLLFYGRLYGVTDVKLRVAELLDRVELTGREHEPIRTFSRGMLQRLSIARALVHNPDIIFLDEPYTGLDQHASHVLTDILVEQFKNEKTILLVSHNLVLGYRLASRILIMRRGEIVFDKPKTDVAEADFENIYLEAVDSGASMFANGGGGE